MVSWRHQQDIRIHFIHNVMATIKTSRNPFIKGKPPACQLMYGRCVVCLGGGGTLPGPSRGGGDPGWSIGGESTSVFTSRGGPFACSLLGGVHFRVHFGGGGVPCDLSNNALIYHYRMPQCIIGKIHMGPPPPTSLTD